MHAREVFIELPIAFLEKLGELLRKKLFYTKCIPILLYGLKSFSLCQYQLKSLDFVISRFFMKLFKTNDIHVVAECQELFGIDLPSVQLARCSKKFFDKFERYRISLLS